MSAAIRYFVIAAGAGHPHRRYALLAADGRTVIGLQISRPDGLEVPRPADVRWCPRAFIGGDEPRLQAPAPRFHNVDAAAHARARGNAARKLRRVRKETC